jgi:SAM-dependent methyltransferase
MAETTDAHDVDDRIERERRFHDQDFEHKTRNETVDKYYTVAKESFVWFDRLLGEIPAGASVLEYGCGEGSHVFDLAGSASVTGIDLSPVAIRHAQEEAARRGVSIQLRVMDAERLDFPDRSFDVVLGSGILHHLDLSRALPEIVRVLKEDGQIIFMEPLGHNPLINLYRRRTPHLRTPDEHPLLKRDLMDAARRFESMECRYFVLCALAAVPFRSTPIFPLVRRSLEMLDRLLFRIPLLRQFAWFVAFRCRCPQQVAAGPIS